MLALTRIARARAQGWSNSEQPGNGSFRLLAPVALSAPPLGD
jgi:hypothetical protein